MSKINSKTITVDLNLTHSPFTKAPIIRDGSWLEHVKRSCPDKVIIVGAANEKEKESIVVLRECGIFVEESAPV